MGLSCKSKSAIAVCNSTRDVRSHPRTSSATLLESFKYRDLESSTNFFARENLVLKGSHGQLFRANLPDGRVVVVKRPDTSQRSHQDAFENEVQILSKLFSRRLVNLLGCSRDGRVTLLVLEDMENGPLHESLTEPVVSLSWPMRVKLSVDVAKAVRALHASSPPIVHRNLRCSNVFIDRDGCARLADFCLAKVIPEQADPPRRSSLISIPELATDEDYARYSSAAADDMDAASSSSSSSESRISPKTDVYSFGILLLQIMSGRAGVDDDPRGLLAWALPLIKHGHAMAICDPTIAPFPDSAAVRIMASVAARCVRSSSARRPAMEDVVQCLVKASKLVPEPMWTSSVSTPSYPFLTPSSTSSRNTSRKASRVAASLRKENLINANLDAGNTPFNTGTATSTSTSVGFPKISTTKKTLVFRLGRFLVRKLRVARRGSSFDNSQSGDMNAKKTALKTAQKSAHKNAHKNVQKNTQKHAHKNVHKNAPKGAYRSGQKVSLTSRSPLKGAKVSDDLEFVEMEDLDWGLQKMEPKKTRSEEKSKASRFGGYHRSGKKFVRL